MGRKSKSGKKPVKPEAKKKNDEWWVILMPLFFLIPALVMIGFGINYYYRAITSASWPSVTGIITQARVERCESSDDDGHTDVSYCIRYHYAYEVDGVQFTYSEYCISTNIYCYSEEKDALAHQMEKGMEIKVYYNPEKPSDSCVQRSEQITHIGAVLIIIGLGMFAMSIFLSITIIKGMIS